jgi:Ca2+-binding RTX toxin-like protein
MNLHKLISWSLVSLMGLILLGIVSAFAAANTVPRSYLTDQVFAVTPNDLKPPECAHINVTHIVDIGAGQSPQGNRNELILGTPGNDILDLQEKYVLDGRGGNDCILGGAGDDVLIGGRGSDVLLGGPGDDRLVGKGDGDGPPPGNSQAGDTDICYDGGGNNIFEYCDTTYP